MLFPGTAVVDSPTDGTVNSPTERLQLPAQEHSTFRELTPHYILYYFQHCLHAEPGTRNRVCASTLERRHIVFSFRVLATVESFGDTSAPTETPPAVATTLRLPDDSVQRDW